MLQVLSITLLNPVIQYCHLQINIQSVHLDLTHVFANCFNQEFISFTREHESTVSDKICNDILIHCGQMTSQNLINICSGNGLLNNYHQWYFVAFIWGQFHRKFSKQLCLTAPSHYLNQFRLIIIDGLWHLPKGSQEMPPILPSRTGKIMLWMDKIFHKYIEIVCATCPNILKMGIWMGAMKSLSRTLTTILEMTLRLQLNLPGAYKFVNNISSVRWLYCTKAILCANQSSRCLNICSTTCSG